MEPELDPGVYDKMLRVVETCAARIQWRLRPYSRRRLIGDIMFLCAGLRPVILMDYGGTMSQLQENLCSLLQHARQEASILNPLRVMVIKDMLYLVHVKGLAEHASPNARSQYQLAFVDLEKSCCELIPNTEGNDAVLELVSIQDLFAAKFPVEAATDVPVIQPGTTEQKSKVPERGTGVNCIDISTAAKSSLVIDLSVFLESTQIALPCLNGWLLGYPITYMFRNGSSDVAIQNLSKYSLHIYRIYVIRSRQSDAKLSEEELLSFSVPCEISMRREEEPWAQSFLSHMNEKLERCNHIWASMRLQIEKNDFLFLHRCFSGAHPAELQTFCSLLFFSSSWVPPRFHNYT